MTPKPYIPNDNWSRRAASEGYRARSVYKLQELDDRFHLMRSGMKVLDIGAAPGSWLQYVSKKIGPTGVAIGLDLKSIESIAPNVQTFVADMNDHAGITAIMQSLSIPEFDLVLSDIAPNTSGIKDVDQWRSLELSRAVVAVARNRLKPGGYLVMKVFRGRDFDAFLHEVSDEYSSVRQVSVDATRDRSREVYVVCRNG